MSSHGLLDCIGNTPLLDLPSFRKWIPENVSIQAKAEFRNPGGSVKDRPAKKMILEAIREGRLTRGKTILDSSSGNTAIGYAIVASALGYKLEVVMPENASEKKRIIESLGARIIFTDPLEGSDGAILEAQRIYEKDPGRYYMPDQYNNPNNWKAHYETTAEEIWRQTQGKITHFVAGIGTSGTLMGAGRRLRELKPDIQIVAVEPAGALHGLEGLKHMESSIVPGIYDPKVHQRKMSIYTEDAYEMTCRLARQEGILVGYSSGAALQASYLLANEIGEGRIVTVFCDGGDRYLRTQFWDEVLRYWEDHWKSFPP
ncbi:MAG: cysteine synthase [Elusimicrobia bacterium RIFCSPLOWO2_01_FULL_64_13]|nr:MAG: cysteine synthase [Elusimicrobia bacterium RIFCSPHIGHO2_01_FULL_64_10]OGR94255.1 MAG: cysteine synthase [Elusimicrobia bacterium RIFCSPLOWO2_01_FULL_64_13]